MPLRQRLALRGIDGVTLLVVPAVAVRHWPLFVYPFIYGLILSFTAQGRRRLANYQKFFSDPFLYDTIADDALARRPGDDHQIADRRAGRNARAADERISDC